MYLCIIGMYACYHLSIKSRPILRSAATFQSHYSVIGKTSENSASKNPHWTDENPYQ